MSVASLFEQGQEKYDTFEAELTTMQTEVSYMTPALLTFCSKASVRPEADSLIMQKCNILEKERNELRASLKTSEEQLGTVRREVVALTLNCWIPTGTC